MAAAVPACRFCIVTRICTTDSLSSARANTRVSIGAAMHSWNMLSRISSQPNGLLSHRSIEKAAGDLRRLLNVYCSSAIPVEKEKPKQKQSARRQRQSKTGGGGRRKAGVDGDGAAGTSSREDVRTLRIKRIVSEIQKHMENLGYLEIETCLLQGAAGGADARQFVTFHNALGRGLFLPIVTELHLKRMVARAPYDMDLTAESTADVSSIC